ncbi:hypothetical protein EXIGLDRAFT_727770 [Exidia glandulosa HHB12029]|uniref:Pheromone n=1 Tax=Exidia glandulosa HHB12029 TaxID=1314781 RepID=A0A165D7M6_EXIGL|nr:hypothetical protein EXIGLDRAFT_727770 [Exidia glandulosa HHB12029]
MSRRRPFLEWGARKDSPIKTSRTVSPPMDTVNFVVSQPSPPVNSDDGTGNPWGYCVIA